MVCVCVCVCAHIIYRPILSAPILHMFWSLNMLYVYCTFIWHKCCTYDLQYIYNLYDTGVVIYDLCRQDFCMYIYMYVSIDRYRCNLRYLHTCWISSTCSYPSLCYCRYLYLSRCFHVQRDLRHQDKPRFIWEEKNKDIYVALNRWPWERCIWEKSKCLLRAE